MQSSWSVLTIILHISKSCGLLEEHDPTLFESSHGHVPTWSGGCHWSFSVEPQSRGCLCWAHRKLIPCLVLLLSGSYGHFICVKQVMQSPEAVSISESATSSLDESESDEAWSLVLLKLPAAVASSGSAVALVGLEGQLVGSCPCCCLKLDPAYSTNLHVSLPPCTELCSVLALTSWESSCHKWLPSEPLEECSHFCMWGWQGAQQMCTLPGECLQRDIQ